MKHYIMCPYYKSHRGFTIKCEDSLHYFGKDGVEQQIIKHCESDWHSCKYAQTMEKFYAETKPENYKSKRIALERDSLNAEMQKLITKVGILEKKIKEMTEVAKSNHEMYQRTLDQKQKMIDAYASQARWTESLAAAFLVTAYDLGTKVDIVEISKDEISRLMQAYKLQITQTEDGNAFRFKVERKTE